MNKKLIEVMFYTSGLPASAMVAHACLEDDLGFDKTKMSGLADKINAEFKVSIPEQVWSVFERVGDIDDYLKKVKNGHNN